MTSNRLLAVLAVLTIAACAKEATPPPAPVAAPAAAPAPAPSPAPAPTPAPTPAAAAELPHGTIRLHAGPLPAPATVTEERLVAAGPHAKVGDAKCRMCHKLQHDSWSETPHKAKGLDCEGCHGGGVDFVKVMRDRAAAVAAGLLLPKKDFCLRCHRADWQDAMLLRVHAHKAK